MTPTSEVITLPSPTMTPPTTVPPTPTYAALPGGPVILTEAAAGAETVALIRYESAGQTCLTATFNLRILDATRCGPFSGAGVGFVETLTDSAGQGFRVAYGLVLDETITAVAVEFYGGGNTNAMTQSGGYLLVLEAGQTPQRALGINQYGNLVGSWTFEE